MIVYDIEQGSDEWHLLRAGIPTASEFKNLVSGTLKESKSLTEYARRLAIETYSRRASLSFGGSYHTKRGQSLEPFAVEEYELVNDVTAGKVGFILDCNEEYGASPDRLIDDDGVLEIKCLSDKEHFRVLEYYDQKGDIQPGYKPQLWGELLVTERQWADILFFHPDLPSMTHRVLPNYDYLDMLIPQLKKLYKEREKMIAFLNKFSGAPLTPPKPKSKLTMEI